MASATATIFGLSIGLVGLQCDQINESESESVTEMKINLKKPSLIQAGALEQHFR